MKYNYNDFPRTCKCRVDRVSIYRGHIIELKTSENASQFERKAAEYYYDMQAAWNTWGVKEVTGCECQFTFIVVEKENPSPETIRFIQYNKEVIQEAEKLIIKNLDKYAKCKQTDVWPGYRNNLNKVGLEIIDLPKWRKYADK